MSMNVVKTVKSERFLSLISLLCLGWRLSLLYTKSLLQSHIYLVDNFTV